jgi:hypothetical protein
MQLPPPPTCPMPRPPRSSRSYYWRVQLSASEPTQPARSFLWRLTD